MLLRRSKSGEMKGRKGQQARDAELQRQRNVSVPKSPPRLPQLYDGAPAPQFDHFGGDPRPDSVAIVSGRADRYQHSTPRASMEQPRIVASFTAPAVPPIPHGSWEDSYARTESMTHRGRYSYASSVVSTVNSPRRIRRRKDPTPFKQANPFPSIYWPWLTFRQYLDRRNARCRQDIIPRVPQDRPGPS